MFFNKIRRFTLAMIVTSMLSSLFVQVNASKAADYIMEAAVGYDDNYGLSSHSQGSGFAMYDFLVLTKIPLNIPYLELTGLMNGAYQDYFSISDNFSIKGGVDSKMVFARDRLPVTFSYTGEVYRDREFTEDDLNSQQLALTCEWSDFARFIPAFFYSIAWQNYETSFGDAHAMENPFSAGELNMHGDGKGNGKNRKIYPGESRNDRLWMAEGRLMYYISPFLTSEMAVSHTRCSSSQKIESYRADGISVSLFKRTDAWELSALASIKRFDYDWYPKDSGGAVDRRDLKITGGVGVSYFFKKYEFFLKADITDNHSDINEESYLSRVLKCGISRLF